MSKLTITYGDTEIEEIRYTNPSCIVDGVTKFTMGEGQTRTLKTAGKASNGNIKIGNKTLQTAGKWLEHDIVASYEYERTWIIKDGVWQTGWNASKLMTASQSSRYSFGSRAGNAQILFTGSSETESGGSGSAISSGSYALNLDHLTALHIEASGPVSVGFGLTTHGPSALEGPNISIPAYTDVIRQNLIGNIREYVWDLSDKTGNAYFCVWANSLTERTAAIYNLYIEG